MNVAMKHHWFKMNCEQEFKQSDEQKLESLLEVNKIDRTKRMDPKPQINPILKLLNAGIKKKIKETYNNLMLKKLNSSSDNQI